jgi:MFS family permease
MTIGGEKVVNEPSKVWDMKRRPVRAERLNALYLIAAISMILMTMVIALQPLFLRSMIGLDRGNAGFVNANIQVVTEIADLFLIGYMGYLSDRFGRIPIIVAGFIMAGAMALLAPFSAQIGVALGLSGLAVFYISRTIMSLGMVAVWPQIATLAGDFSTTKNRPRLMANAGFMMAFGITLSYAALMQIPQHVGLTVSMLFLALLAFAGAWFVQSFLSDVAPRLEGPAAPLDDVFALLKKERKLRLAFVSAFFSRNDMVVIGLFLMVWCVYFAEILSIDHARAAAWGGLLIGYIGAVSLLSIPLWGVAIERMGRVRALALAMGLSGIGLLGFGAIVNPLGWLVILPSTLVAMGQAGCLIAPQTLALDLAPERIRGSVLGAFNTAGCLGVVLFLFVGGILFDEVGPPAPFVMTGVANTLIAGYALIISRQEREEFLADGPVDDITMA